MAATEGRYVHMRLLTDRLLPCSEHGANAGGRQAIELPVYPSRASSATNPAAYFSSGPVTWARDGSLTSDRHLPLPQNRRGKCRSAHPDYADLPAVRKATASSSPRQVSVMRGAGLHDGLLPDRADRIGQALQPVADQRTPVPGAAVLDLGQGSSRRVLGCKEHWCSW